MGGLEDPVPETGRIPPAAVLAAALIDGDGLVSAWTPGAEALLGHTAAEAVGFEATRLTAGSAQHEILKVVAGRRPWAGRLPLIHRDGRTVVADLQAIPLSTEQPNSPWMVVALETADPEGGSGVLKRWAYDQLPVALAFFDEEARLVGVNAAAEQGVGIPFAKLKGRRVSDFYRDTDLTELEKVLAQALRAGETGVLEAYGRRPGIARNQAWTVLAYPLRDSADRVRGVATASMDTTAQYLARERLAIVNAVGARVGTTLDAYRTAQELADVATEGFADFVSVELLAPVAGDGPPGVRPTGVVVLRRAGLQSVLEGCPEAVIAVGADGRYPRDSPMARALATGESRLYALDDPVIAHWLDADEERRLIVQRFGVHSMIAVPVVSRGAVLGVVQYLRHRNAEGFDRDDLLLGEEITARAALATDNAFRYAQERHTALTLQRSLLPSHAPAKLTLETASRYLPIGAHEGAGGDWFDVIPLSGARVGLVVGDVVGHGIHASATMGRLRTAVRTLADIDVPPDELLTHLDDLVLRLAKEEDTQDSSADQEQPEPGYIGATCLYAVYDPVTRRCVIARAGHPAPAIVRPDGLVEFPESATGPPLGLGGLPFESEEVDLPDGSLIALYTDGLLEAGERDIDIGIARLSAVLGSTSSPLEQICDDVLASLPAGAPADDIALLIARTRGLDGSQVAALELPSDPAAVSAARRFAGARLAEWGLGEASFTTELVVSELVTNAIRYGEPPVRLRLIRDAALTCEVSDAGSTAPHLRRARAFDEGGRGLLLVAQLCERWGCRHTRDGKIIWAERTLPAAD